MTLLQIAMTTIGCLLIQDPSAVCLPQHGDASNQVAAMQETKEPEFTGNSIDVILTADTALAWDVETGKVLYKKEADTKRPVASINKLLSVLAVREALSPNATVEITSDVIKAQRAGADIRLPIGEHTSVRSLLEASMIASANDAMVALAVAAKGSEEKFVEYANRFAIQKGLDNTVIANATGLSGGTQYSTAYDVQRMLTLAYEDSLLRPYLSQAKGVLNTFEGSRREYDTTNQLSGTYMPVLAAKTGYTEEAKQNLTMITIDDEGHKIGAVILGSDQRFQDMKVLVEWVWRNYTW